MTTTNNKHVLKIINDFTKTIYHPFFIEKNPFPNSFIIILTEKKAVLNSFLIKKNFIFHMGQTFCQGFQ